LDKIVELLEPNAKVVVSEGDTQGSACTTLLAIDYIEDDQPLIIAPSNQLFIDNANDIVKYFMKEDFDGGIVTFEDVHPKFSYVKIDENGLVCEASEKRPISKHATAGFYYFKKGKDFVDSTIKMISKNATSRW